MTVRILMVIPQAFYTTRGTPLSAYHRTRELLKMGHQVDILTYPIGGNPPELAARVMRSRGPHFVKEISAGPTKIKIWFDLLLFLNLIFVLARNRYDLIYTHEEAAFLARILKPVFRIPYVYDMHSSLPLQISDWKFSKSKTVIGLFEWVERQCVKNAAAIVAISPSVEEAGLKAWPAAKSVVIVNHFEQNEIATPADGTAIRDKYGIGSDERLVLYTGSFVELQKLDLLIDSIPFVIREVPNAVFMLVGGRAEEIAKLESQCVDLGIRDKVRFVENRPQSEMSAFMQACQVLVSPRTQGINPPGKLFAYLESQRPVVATDCLVHNQLISSDCAILSAPDAASFARAITQALTDSHNNERVLRGAETFLEKYCSVSARQEAYARLMSYLPG